MSKKLFIRGTLLLTFTGLFSRLIGFFYRIFLSHTIGAHGLGIFQLVLPLQLLILSVCASGIQTAISRLTASEITLGHSRRAGDYFLTGTVFSVSFSLIFSWLLYTYADFWACHILKEPQTVSLIRLLSFSIPLSTFHSCVNSYYFGRKKAAFPAGVQLIEQIFRVGGCYLLYLILVSQGRAVTPVIAVGGNLIGEIASSFLSLFTVSMHFQKTSDTSSRTEKPFLLLKDLFQISVPLTLNKVLLTILGSIEVILIPARLQMSGLSSRDALSIYGIFTGMALPLILFPATVTNSAAVMLLPSITELQTLGYQKRIRYVISQIFRYCLLLGGVCMILFLFLGEFSGQFFISQPDCRYLHSDHGIHLPFPLSEHHPHKCAERTGQIHCLPCPQRRQHLYFASALFCSRFPDSGYVGYLYGILCGELVLTVLHVYALSEKHFPYRHSDKNGL